MGEKGGRTDTNIDLPNLDLVGNVVHSGKTTGALPVNSVDTARVRNPSMQSRHPGSRRSPTSRQHVTDSDILNQLRVEVD